MGRGRNQTTGRAATPPRPASMQDAMRGRRSGTETAGGLSPQEKRKRKEARIRKRVEEAHQRVSAGIVALRDAEEFKAYLRTLSRFHRYSFMNNLLIRSQRPDATMVASESAWKRMGRSLRTTDENGATLPRAERRPIHIFTPRTFIKTVIGDDGEEEKIRMVNPRAFGTASVYDISQTEGKPLPQAPQAQALEGESAEAEEMIQALASWCRSNKIPFRAESGIDGAQTAGDGSILIDADLPHNQRGLLFARETARAALSAQTETWSKLSGDERALAVEGASYAIAAGFGVEAESATFPTMVLLADDRKGLERSLAAIQKATHAVLGADGEPAGADAAS